MNESEKITINLGIVELAQIDVLVEQGLYSNRSDFIRTATRKLLEDNQNRFDNLLEAKGVIGFARVIGISHYSKKDLELLVQAGKKLDLFIIGKVIFDYNIEPELFKKAVKRVTVYGKIDASNEIIAILNEDND